MYIVYIRGTTTSTELTTYIWKIYSSNNLICSYHYICTEYKTYKILRFFLKIESAYSGLVHVDGNFCQSMLLS